MISVFQKSGRLPCRRIPAAFILLAVLTFDACSAQNPRGIADKRSNFEKFLPMEGQPAKYGLREVRPFFRTGNREAILRAIERACQGGKRGSSLFDPKTQGGFYVNCNPENRQLLNGYVPVSASVRPHS